MQNMIPTIMYRSSKIDDNKFVHLSIRFRIIFSDIMSLKYIKLKTIWLTNFEWTSTFDEKPVLIIFKPIE